MTVFSIAHIACGLIFKGLTEYASVLTDVFCDKLRWRKPLKIRPLRSLGGISFEISSFKDPHDLRQILDSGAKGAVGISLMGRTGSCAIPWHYAGRGGRLT